MADTERMDLEHAAAVLKSGGVILYPTETVWGIGCDATCESAIHRVYQIKQRTDSKALITLVENTTTLQDVVGVLPEKVQELITRYTKALTLVYPDAPSLPGCLKAKDGSAAIRVTSNDFCRQLCKILGKPLVSTSANQSGKPTPMSFREIDPQIISAVDYVCTTGRTQENNTPPSTVALLNKDYSITILRP